MVNYHNNLGIRATLANRKIIFINLCALCNSHPETLDHFYGEFPSLTSLKILPDLKLWLSSSFSNDTFWKIFPNFENTNQFKKIYFLNMDHLKRKK